MRHSHTTTAWGRTLMARGGACTAGTWRQAAHAGTRGAPQPPAAWAPCRAGGGLLPTSPPPAGRGCGAGPLSRRTPPGRLQPGDEVARSGRRRHRPRGCAGGGRHSAGTMGGSSWGGGLWGGCFHPPPSCPTGPQRTGAVVRAVRGVIASMRAVGANTHTHPPHTHSMGQGPPPTTAPPFCRSTTPTPGRARPRRCPHCAWGWWHAAGGDA